MKFNPTGEKSDIEKARELCSKVAELAKEYNLPFFFVTKGASITRNNGCDAVRNAREAQIEWEKRNGADPHEDWMKDKKK